MLLCVSLSSKFLAEKAKRSTRTHAGQFEIFVGHVAEHEQLRTGAGDPVKLGKLWQNLTAQLNAYGAAPTKTTEGWQSTFMNWKHQLRRKARVIKEHANGTGGGPPCDKKLTDIEERALSLWGREVIHGSGAGIVGFGPCLPSVNFKKDIDSDDDIDMSDMPAEPNETHRPTPKKKPKRVSHKERIANLMKESDDVIAAAISRLADRIGDLAACTYDSNELFREVIKNQEKMLALLTIKVCGEN